MKIWLDLSNSPHALLFAPIARRFKELGHTLLVTARDNAQTVALARDEWPELRVVGGETPSGRAAKMAVLARRSCALSVIARSERPDVALSHNSYAQLLATRMLRIPALTAMDFEFQPANHIAFRAADRILLPSALREVSLRAQGVTTRKVRYYDGFKEEIYLGDFVPNVSIRTILGAASSGSLIVVARTPPFRAVYHHFPNPLFWDALHTLVEDPAIELVVLARHEEEWARIQALNLRAHVPVGIVDSRSLLLEADAFLGGGGTMTREAALFGVPTFSVFAGRRSAVDAELERRGRLKFVQSVGDIVIGRVSHDRAESLDSLRARGARLVDEFVTNTLALAASAPSPSAPNR